MQKFIFCKQTNSRIKNYRPEHHKSNFGVYIAIYLLIMKVHITVETTSIKDTKVLKYDCYNHEILQDVFIFMKAKHHLKVK